MLTAVIYTLILAAVLVVVPMIARPHLRPRINLANSPLAPVIILGLPGVACLLAILLSL
jgi:hypothetical protein